MTEARIEPGFRFRLHVDQFYVQLAKTNPRFLPSATLPDPSWRVVKLGTIHRHEHALVFELKRTHEDGVFTLYVPHRREYVVVHEGVLFLSPNEPDAVPFRLELVPTTNEVYIRMQETLRYVRYIVQEDRIVVPESYVVVGVLSNIGFHIPSELTRQSRWKLEPVDTEASGTEKFTDPVSPPSSPPTSLSVHGSTICGYIFLLLLIVTLFYVFTR